MELHGERIYKPFVEKPASGEDHNIHIYYPHSMVCDHHCGSIVCAMLVPGCRCSVMVHIR